MGFGSLLDCLCPWDEDLGGCMKSSEILTQLKRIADALEKLSAKQFSDPIAKQFSDPIAKQSPAPITNDVLPLKLLSSAQFGKVDAVKELISKGVDVNFQCPDSGFTALHFATQNNRLSTVEALVACSGVNINIKSANGWTALMWAAYLPRTAIVEALLNVTGIDVNAKTNDGSTALMYAARYGHTKSIAALLKHPDIDFNAKNDKGENALKLAADNSRPYIVYLLKKAGAV